MRSCDGCNVRLMLYEDRELDDAEKRKVEVVIPGSGGD
jgi:hypothetical protein